MALHRYHAGGRAVDDCHVKKDAGMPDCGSTKKREGALWKCLPVVSENRLNIYLSFDPFSLRLQKPEEERRNVFEFYRSFFSGGCGTAAGSERIGAAAPAIRLGPLALDPKF